MLVCELLQRLYVGFVEDAETRHLLVTGCVRCLQSLHLQEGHNYPVRTSSLTLFTSSQADKQYAIALPRIALPGMAIVSMTLRDCTVNEQLGQDMTRCAHLALRKPGTCLIHTCVDLLFAGRDPHLGPLPGNVKVCFSWSLMWHDHVCK